MSSDQVKDEKLPFLFAPAIKQGLLNHEVNINPERVLLSERADQVIRRLATFSHFADLYNWCLMFGAEMVYDVYKAPQRNEFALGIIGRHVDEVPSLSLDPGLKQQLDSLGDVLEVSSLHLAGRAGLALVNELLLSKPVKETTKSIFSSTKLRSLFEKFLDDKTIEKYADRGEIQLSDDARFWISLVPVLMFMSAHSLGYIDSPNPDHWHGGDPVPWMLKGQFLAASSLVASHYAVKYSDKVSSVVRGLIGGTRSSVQELEQLMVRMSKDVGNLLEKSGKRIDAMLVDGFEVVQERVMAGMNDFSHMHELAGDWFETELKVAELVLIEKLGTTKKVKS